MVVDMDGLTDRPFLPIAPTSHCGLISTKQTPTNAVSTKQ